ncbi:hypothetical protein PFICI_04303 [Pestalotiopsis fici W106-1]|uniref:SH3 domain-containing protein n=1 Tax=Pestalotiopsis fici (strain W106-1 / CGMCC3.15140) TaxID=1229662 RepID=W3XAI6_PESFW|nr:uncharacterized protein PFICI_04303 [Pestalotiopsis fici W106-1]ETS82427.1 hypothetical protein PFICI_04303 [Pestalotiopsis fici W106-1]
MPNHHEHKHLARAETVYATVYTTLSATFTDEIAGYSTVGVDNTATSVANAAATTAAAEAAASDDSTLPASLVATGTVDVGSESNLAMATSTSSTSAKASSTTGSAASTAAAAAASSSTSSSSSSTGDSSGVKAGIAFGVLGGLLLFGLLAWFLFNKRRKQMEQQKAIDNEKMSGNAGAAATGAAVAGGVAFAAAANRRDSVQTTHTTADAPRLELRPVTQFMPNFGERRSSKGAALALGLAPIGNNSQARTLGAGTDRPSTSQSHENPFGSGAEQLDGVSEMSVQAASQPHNPFDAPENVVGLAQSTDEHNVSPISEHAPDGFGSAATGAAAGAAAGVAVGTALTRKQSKREAPQTLDLTKANKPAQVLDPIPAPASPAGTEFSLTEMEPGQTPGPSSSAAAIAAAGGPPQSTVHRVQLDFKPTLDDEIELKAGQLVRMLHEYDDGWALCIRLDRSAQGVCPRTCLSTRPVKPRPGPPGAGPRGPPVNPAGRGPPRGPGAGPGQRPPPGQRPMTPQGGPFPQPNGPKRPMNGPGRPQSPAMMRPQSPAGMGRPQSPAMMRPQSPAMMRPQSPAGMGRPQSPGPRQRGYSQSSQRNGPGPSPMNPASGSPPQGPIGRKPVPGQAY